MELLSRGYDVRIGKNLNNEVDFVAEEELEKFHLEVLKTLKDFE